MSSLLKLLSIMGLPEPLQPMPKPVAPKPKPHVHRSREILAHRAWNVDDDGYLWSVTAECRWDGPVLDNQCAPVENMYVTMVPFANTRDKRIGIFASKRPREWSGTVHGTVALSGTVIEGKTGYRAERAVIRSLIVTTPTATRNVYDLQTLLSERYQCEVEVACEPAPTQNPQQQVGAVVQQLGLGRVLVSRDGEKQQPAPSVPSVAGYSRYSGELWAIA